MKNETETQDTTGTPEHTQKAPRGVKKGSRRGSYKKASAPRGLFSMRFSDEERAQIDAMRGNLSISAFIRQKLGLTGSNPARLTDKTARKA